MANTIWNASDKSAGITLSNLNLTATNNNNAITGGRGVDKQVSGKFYWEYTCTTFTGSQNAVGIASSNIVLTSIGGSSAVIGNCVVGKTAGNVIIDGSLTGLPALGAINSGAVVCIAVDLSARLAWFRLGAAGNWNNAATANPATGVGGVFTPSLGGGIAAYPAVAVNNTNDAVTANFGDTAFAGTVPSGFTSGFTAGVTSSTNAIATQSALEHWLSVNAPAQVTQVALEQWASVAAALPSTQNINAMVLA